MPEKCLQEDVNFQTEGASEKQTPRVGRGSVVCQRLALLSDYLHQIFNKKQKMNQKQNKQANKYLVLNEHQDPDPDSDSEYIQGRTGG